MLGRLSLSVFGGLLLAGLVHVVAILTIPDAAPRSAVTRVSEAVGGETGRVFALPADGSVLPDLDPLFVHAACLFDSRKGAIELQGVMPDALWTFAVVSQTRGVVASLERSAAADDGIRIVVAPGTDIERIRLTRAGTAAAATTYAAVDMGVGFVLLRVFAAPGSDPAALSEALARLRCAAIAD